MSGDSSGDPEDVSSSNVRKNDSEGNVTDIINHAESQRPHVFDQANESPDTMQFTGFDIFLLIFSMTTYLVDLGMDIYVACMYYKTGYISYASLTLVFVIVPALIMSAFSLRW